MGGSERSVAVGDGIKMVGIRVGRGKGLRSESGFAKIDANTITRAMVATSTTIVKISQDAIFFIASFPLKSV